MQQHDRLRRAGRPSPQARTGRPLDRRVLAKYLNLWDFEVDDLVANQSHRLIVRLQSLLRQERQRGVNGHWTYDVARHRQLRNCLDWLRNM